MRFIFNLIHGLAVAISDRDKTVPLRAIKIRVYGAAEVQFHLF